MHKSSFNPVPFPAKCISWKGKDSQKMHKKTERDIRTKTPTVHSNNPRTLNEFAKQLFLVTHEDKPHKYSSTIFRLFFSFFYLNFFEPRANNQSSNFRKSVERNRRQDTSSLTINSVHSIHSLDGILEENFINSWKRTSFERIDGSNELDRNWCDFRANRSRDETRLVPFVWHAIDKLVIFSADVNFSSSSPSPFLLVLCPFFVHRHVDLVRTRDVYLVE